MIHTYQRIDFDAVIKRVLIVMKYEKDPQWTISQEAFHDSGYLLCLCVNGYADYHVGDTFYRLQPGDVVFLHRNEPRNGNADEKDPWCFIVTLFEIETESERDAELLKSLLGVHRMNSQTVFALFHELHHVWITKATGYSFRSRCLVEQILIELLLGNDKDRSRGYEYQMMDEVVSLMVKNPQCTYQAAELAKKYHLSEGYFRTQFKKHTGMTVTNYQNFLRVNRAKEYLMFGMHNVSETAQMLGFSSAYYFSRVFKRIDGHMPSEYMNMK